MSKIQLKIIIFDVDPIKKEKIYITNFVSIEKRMIKNHVPNMHVMIDI